MASPPKIKRIRVEDFDEEIRPAIGKIAAAMNDFMDETIFVLNGKVDYVNLNRQLASFSVQTDSSGNVINPPSILSNLRSKCVGVVPLSVVNTKNPNTYPTSQPFIAFTINESIVKILAIKGLAASQSYLFTVELVGANV